LIIPLEGSHSSSDWDQLWNDFLQSFPTEAGLLDPVQIGKMNRAIEVFGGQTNRIVDIESLHTKGYAVSSSEYREPAKFDEPLTFARRLWGRSEAGGLPWARLVQMVGVNKGSAYNPKTFRAKVAELRAALKERQLQATEVSWPGPSHMLVALTLCQRHLSIISGLKRLRGVPNLLDPAGSRIAVDAVQSIHRDARDLARLGYEDQITQPYRLLARQHPQYRLTPATDLVTACNTCLMAIGGLFSRSPSEYQIPTLESWRTSVRLDPAAQRVEEKRLVDSLAREVANPGSREEGQVTDREMAMVLTKQSCA
jgi:hypothetical protein